MNTKKYLSTEAVKKLELDEKKIILLKLLFEFSAKV